MQKGMLHPVNATHMRPATLVHRYAGLPSVHAMAAASVHACMHARARMRLPVQILAVQATLEEVGAWSAAAVAAADLFAPADRSAVHFDAQDPAAELIHGAGLDVSGRHYG